MGSPNPADQASASPIVGAFRSALLGQVIIASLIFAVAVHAWAVLRRRRHGPGASAGQPARAGTPRPAGCPVHAPAARTMLRRALPVSGGRPVVSFGGIGDVTLAAITWRGKAGRAAGGAMDDGRAGRVGGVR
jgi:hypothetical protein